MKSSNIGGQAVLEGIMMRNGDKYAVGVRTPEGEIALDIQEYTSVVKWKHLRRIPFVRGVFNFIDSMVMGMKTLAYSASFFEEEEEKQKKELDDKEKVKEAKKESLIMGVTITFSIILAVAVFMVLPYFITDFLSGSISSRMVKSLIEGAVRLGIFIAYILLISKMKDIQRVFMYHGAEHKCINCIEHGLELNVNNVRKSSKEHKRCGTSFLLFVMIVGSIAAFFIQAESPVLRVLLRVALLPLIAGVSYELIKLAGSSDNILVRILSKPGMWMQELTTKEPEDDMIEVAIAAVEAVFDWKAYIKENELESEL